MPIYRLGKRIEFPDPALAGRDGLVAVGGDLCPERLLAAYAAGIFPWYSAGDPILWYSPDPRMVLHPAKFKRSASLRRLVQSRKFELRVDHDFPAVIRKCASVPRHGQNGTWITPEMQAAYIQLHRLGFAHSFETYRDGALVGGLYGIALGAAFFGESMFHEARDASKFAFSALVDHALDKRLHFIDAQQPTPHLRSLGAEDVSRLDFLQQLRQALQPEPNDTTQRATPSA